MRRQRGQATLLLVAGLFGLLLGALVIGAVARGIGVRSEAQRTADLASLAGARAMLDAYPRLFEPAVVDGVPNPAHLERSAYLEIGRAAALSVARRNGDAAVDVSFPDADSLAPARIRVSVTRRVEVRRARATAATELEAVAEAELSATSFNGGTALGDQYAGPYALRQGQRMRPDVAQGFDRLDAAARAAGISLIITSAFRSDAEQALLFARHPDPKWVAPPGTSLHRYGTELDLGPPSAFGWLAARAPAFHFIKRYPWEPWHFGMNLNASSSSRRPADPAEGHPSLPGFVPARFAGDIANAAMRWNVSANLLAAQLYAESGFNPFAVSPVGAQGIAQFMPRTAEGLGLSNPFDARAAIDAQARLMRNLLRQFGSVPLALAAYNAGAPRVAACMCIPPLAETQDYVTQILGLMGGAGDLAGSTLAVRLVR